MLESCLCLGFDRDEYVSPCLFPLTLLHPEDQLTRTNSTILMDDGVGLASAERRR